MTWNYTLGHRFLIWWIFLSDRGAENYKEFVEKFLKNLLDIGANMSVKVHF